MPKFFTPFRKISADKISLSEPEAVHHLKDVLRIKPGEEIVISSPEREEYRVTVEKLLPKSIIAKVKRKEAPAPPEKKISLTIACAIPKKSKMDDIIDKLVQLGVDRVIPLETERVIVKLDRDKKVLRQKRWENIALNAAQQCQRSDIPVIEPIRGISDVVLKADGYDLKVIPTLAGQRKGLREVLESGARNILVLIGPEGDFTDGEIKQARSRGFIPVSLGELVLRVDTAAIAVASFIRLYHENS